MASFALNAPPSVPLKYIVLFGTGALIMRGAGCTINDLWDRNLDNAVGTYALAFPSFPSLRAFHPLILFCFFFFSLDNNKSSLAAHRAIERTKTRPLARGDIAPRQAIAFLAPQLTAGLAVLTQLNWYRCVSNIPSSLPLCVPRDPSHTHTLPPHLAKS
jgi:4-hydroxybenzoate polyprenyltransferase